MEKVEKYCWFCKQCKNFYAIDNLPTSICKNYKEIKEYPYCKNLIEKKEIEIKSEESNKKIMTPKKYNCKIYCKKSNGPVCKNLEISDKIYCKIYDKREICAIKIKDANNYIKLELIPDESFCKKCFYNDRYEKITDNGLLEIKYYDDEEIRFYDENGQLHNDEDKPAKIKQNVEVYFNHGQFVKTIMKNKSLKNCEKRWKCKNIKPGLKCNCNNFRFCSQLVGDELPVAKDCLNFEVRDNYGWDGKIKFPDCDEFWDTFGNLIKTISHPSRYKCNKWKNCKNFETSNDYYSEYQEYRSCKHSEIEYTDNPNTQKFLCYEEKNNQEYEEKKILEKKILEENILKQLKQQNAIKEQEQIKKLQKLQDKILGNNKQQDKYSHLTKSQLINMIEQNNKQEPDKIKVVKKIILNFKRNIEEE